MTFILISVFVLLYVIPKFYIDILQVRYIQKKLHAKAVILPQQDYIKSGKYAIKKIYFSLTMLIYETILFICWVYFGFEMLMYYLQTFLDSQTLQGVAFFMGFLLLQTFLNVPFNYYSTMILDKQYGFSTTTKQLFFIDTLKSFIVLTVIGTIFSYIFIYFADHFEFWWLYGACVAIIAILLFNIFYPIVFAPLFNTFTPLKNEELQKKITHLLDHVGFKNNGVFVMDASRRDGRLNAYFGGIGKAKRVILFDTLLNKVSTDGLLAILGHELGHFKHKDIIKNFFISGVLIFIMFSIAGVLSIQILQDLGIYSNNGGILALMILLSPILSFWAMPLIGYFNRKAEYAADDFGASLTNKSTLANALVRIVNENKSFPHSHPIYVFFHYTHPPLLNRLKVLEYQFEN
ncbi:M48 family metallopeptidase [Helicobacter anatolicus]|uniref:M48 family metallopeptidase n=1 Tax=Helicobacter anatolicus TaxID=2905874 RepID=UPI001E4C1B99|nr:M48 family metallopeptidase [Helicobacter anatolicus]MCE3038618.1 M48 family metallopeptidase [Helicobacter anatolicus]